MSTEAGQLHIALARERGFYRGRAHRLDAAAVAEARRLVGEGVPKAKIARDLGCSRRVLYDALTERGAYASAVSGSVPP